MELQRERAEFLEAQKHWICDSGEFFRIIQFFSTFRNFLEARGIVRSSRGPEHRLDHSPVIMKLRRRQKVP